MNSVQLVAFKAAINADANVTAFVSANDHIAIAAYYNGAGTGFLWRPHVTVEELNTAIVWSEYSTLAVGLQNTYQAMIASGAVNASSPNVQSGFTHVFAGAGGASSRTNLVALVKKVPTKAEMVFTTNNVCTAFGLVVSPNDIAQALGS